MNAGIEKGIFDCCQQITERRLGVIDETYEVVSYAFPNYHMEIFANVKRKEYGCKCDDIVILMTEQKSDYPYLLQSKLEKWWVEIQLGDSDFMINPHYWIPQSELWYWSGMSFYIKPNNVFWKGEFNDKAAVDGIWVVDTEKKEEIFKTLESIIKNEQ